MLKTWPTKAGPPPVEELIPAILTVDWKAGVDSCGEGDGGGGRGALADDGGENEEESANLRDEESLLVERCD